MEVAYNHHPKRLYRHAVPLLIVSLALLGLTTLLFLKYSALPQADRGAVGRALTTPLLKVEPHRNGLAEIRVHQSEPATPAGVGDEFSKLGQALQ